MFTDPVPKTTFEVRQMEYTCLLSREPLCVAVFPSAYDRLIDHKLDGLTKETSHVFCGLGKSKIKGLADLVSSEEISLLRLLSSPFVPAQTSRDPLSSKDPPPNIITSHWELAFNAWSI